MTPKPGMNEEDVKAVNAARAAMGRYAIMAAELAMMKVHSIHVA